MTEETTIETTTEEIAPEESPVEESELELLRAELAETREAFLRARADFQNYKRRTEEERDGLRQYLVADLLTRLLPVTDNFERAIAAASQTQDFEKLVQGVEGIHRQLLDLLAREGVTPIEAVGESFDPNLHNAVLRDESGEYPEGTVVEELQRGYRLQDRVLRPTLVKVAAGG